jgi:hypothetical protein
MEINEVMLLNDFKDIAIVETQENLEHGNNLSLGCAANVIVSL